MHLRFVLWHLEILKGQRKAPGTYGGLLHHSMISSTTEDEASGGAACIAPVGDNLICIWKQKL